MVIRFAHHHRGTGSLGFALASPPQTGASALRLVFRPFSLPPSLMCCCRTSWTSRRCHEEHGVL